MTLQNSEGLRVDVREETNGDIYSTLDTWYDTGSATCVARLKTHCNLVSQNAAERGVQFEG
jgi:hypothetical protein